MEPMVERAATGLLALVLAASGVTGGVAHLCRMTGEVRSSCCCPEPEDDGAERDPTASRPDTCCELRVAEPVTRPLAVEATELRPETAPAVLASVAPPRDRVARVAAIEPRPRGPPASPPLYDLHCAYLI